MKDATLSEHVLYLLDGGACTSPINRRAQRNNPIPQTKVRDRVVGWKLSLQRRFQSGSGPNGAGFVEPLISQNGCWDRSLAAESSIGKNPVNAS